MKSYYNCTTPADWHNLLAGCVQGPNYRGELDNAIIYGEPSFDNVIDFELYKKRGDRGRA